MGSASIRPYAIAFGRYRRRRLERCLIVVPVIGKVSARGLDGMIALTIN